MIFQVDFDSWFTSTLAIEIQNKDNNYRIVRRAAIKLIGKLIFALKILFNSYKYICSINSF